MPLQRPSLILALAPIPYPDIQRHGSTFHAATQDAAAQDIYDYAGLPGLRSLWLCQGLDGYIPARDGLTVPTRNGLTAATSWWLEPGNAHTKLLVDDFASVRTTNEASSLLELATRELRLEIYYTPGNALFQPDDCHDTQSKLWAVHVRALARTFFPHLPQLLEPTNALYFASCNAPGPGGDRLWTPVYEGSTDAFIDEPHALKYLVSLNKPLPANAPPWLIEFSKHGYTEWNMYKTLGLALEDAYQLAVEKERAPREAWALPPLHSDQSLV